MQASRNLSDAWLAHWIRNINQSSVIQPMQPNISLESEPISQSKYILDHAMCFLQKIIVFGNLTECLSDNSNDNNITELSQTQENFEAKNSYYLAVYIAIAIFNSLIALVRAFAFAYAGIKAAKFIHNRLLYSVIYVSDLRLTQCVFRDKFLFSLNSFSCIQQTEFSFFDITPVGRILNRFSSDTNTIDDSLPFIFNILLAQLAGLIGKLWFL